MTRPSRPTPSGWLSGDPPRSAVVPRYPDRHAPQASIPSSSDDGRGFQADEDDATAVPPERPARPDLWTPRQVAEFFGVSERTIRSWRAQGRLTPVRITARTVFYRYENVIGLIDKSTN